jgi:hypothetical protein
LGNAETQRSQAIASKRFQMCRRGILKRLVGREALKNDAVSPLAVQLERPTLVFDDD